MEGKSLQTKVQNIETTCKITQNMAVDRITWHVDMKHRWGKVSMMQWVATCDDEIS